MDGPATQMSEKELRIDEGAPSELPPGTTVWVVGEGEVEVYLVTKTFRRILLVCATGDLVFPLDPGCPDLKLSLVAVSGATLTPSDPSGPPGVLEAGVDRWLDGALSRLTLPPAPDLPESALLQVDPGDGGEITGTIGMTASETAWVTLSGRCEVSHLGHDPGSEAFPLRGPLWALIAPSDASEGDAPPVLDTASTADLAKGGALVPALSRFAQRIAELHSLEQERQDRADARRLARASHADDDPDAAGQPVAALRTAAAALGQPLEGRPLAAKGQPFSALPQLARVAGLRARRIALEGAWWRQDQGPLIVRRAESGEVDTLIFRQGRYTRPGEGKLSASGALAYESRGYAIHAPLPARVTGFVGLAGHVWRGMGSDSALLSVAGAGTALLGMLTPMATGWILGDIVPAGNAGLLVSVGIALIFAALTSTLLSTARAIAMARIGGRGAFGLASALSDRVLRLPASFFKAHSAGDLNQRLAAVEQMRQLVTQVILSSGMTLIFSFVYLGLLFAYDLRLALMALALVLGYVAAVALSRFLQMSSLREAARMDGKVASLTYEILEGIAKLRSGAAEGRAMARWTRAYTEERQAAERGGRVANHFAAFSDAYQILTLLGLFAATAVLARENLPSGVFIAFLAAFGAFQGAFTGFCDSLLSLYAAKPLVERAEPILTAEPEFSENRADPGRLSGAIEATNLAFAYGAGQATVLDGLSFEVAPGEHFAIVGGSGTGKSTIFRLLLGFEKPIRGSITYDGQDLAHIDAARVRAQIGVVLQSSKLFAGSILENIRGASDASLEASMLAAERAGLARDLEMFPMGIHTPVTEGAATLSGGQRQRIMIARALAANPSILFFDEATSALDNTTQALVSRTLDGLKATRITIAHRLSTVRNADRIGVLKSGRFVETGTFDELIARDGEFTALARRQLTE